MQHHNKVLDGGIPFLECLVKCLTSLMLDWNLIKDMYKWILDKN